MFTAILRGNESVPYSNPSDNQRLLITVLSADNSTGIDNVYTEAVEAYEQQIYSRCVRLVESANREFPVDM